MTSNQGALDSPATLPLIDAAQLASFGATTIVAPHPDDESLGCGGLIALLRRLAVPVSILVTSDGTGSHPNSRAYPPEALRDLRESEAVAAVRELGVSPGMVTFLRLPDTKVPHPGDARFQPAVDLCVGAFQRQKPETVVVPWRRDPHIDHRATWHIVDRAVTSLDYEVRIIEYAIWLWDLGEAGDRPAPSEMRGWRLDISSVLDCKLAAIAAHRSQTTDLINDDPNGFRLTPETLAHFQRPWEVYIEAAHG